MIDNPFDDTRDIIESLELDENVILEEKVFRNGEGKKIIWLLENAPDGISIFVGEGNGMAAIQGPMGPVAHEISFNFLIEAESVDEAFELINSTGQEYIDGKQAEMQNKIVRAPASALESNIIRP